MNDELFKKLGENLEHRKIFQQEKLILDVTELIARQMETDKVNKTQLAALMGKGRSYITQLLDGTSNMTLRTIADVFTVLDTELITNTVSLAIEVNQASEYIMNDENKKTMSMSLPLIPCDVDWVQLKGVA